jgi:hypothetical protein
MLGQVGVFPNLRVLIEMGGDLRSNIDQDILLTPGLILDDFSVYAYLLMEVCTSVDGSTRRELEIKSNASHSRWYF